VDWLVGAMEGLDAVDWKGVQIGSVYHTLYVNNDKWEERCCNDHNDKENDDDI
jgi:hypothetical protein